MKNCENYMEKFFSLDKHARLPFKLSMHLLFCKKCRSQVRALTLAEKACASPLKNETFENDATLLSIMKQIDPSYTPTEKIKPVSFRNWIIFGILMVVALLFISALNVSATSTSLSFYFYIIFACIVTVYCALFIGSNMDFFIKQIDKIPPKILNKIKMDIKAI